MARLTLHNLTIQGLAAATGPLVDEVINYPFFSSLNGAARFTQLTGVVSRRRYYEATLLAEMVPPVVTPLINALGWPAQTVDALVLVTLTPDHLLPNTAYELLPLLGFPNTCFAFDLRQGCAGYVNALAVLGSLMQTGQIRRALLVTAERPLSLLNSKDESTYPLFGEAVACTAIEYVAGNGPWQFSLENTGEGFEALYVPNSGLSHQKKDDELGPSWLRMDGPKVFEFSVSKVPPSIQALLNDLELSADQIDRWIFHQANALIINSICKKLGIATDRAPLTLTEFGNTSSASIPLTLVAKCRNSLTEKTERHAFCGFGMGLSWATAILDVNPRVVLPLLQPHV